MVQIHVSIYPSYLFFLPIPLAHCVHVSTRIKIIWLIVIVIVIIVVAVVVVVSAHMCVCGVVGRRGETMISVCPCSRSKSHSGQLSLSAACLLQTLACMMSVYILPDTVVQK